MAIELNPIKTSISSTGDRIFVEDQTGAYVLVDNETGYGAPNEERTDIVLFATAFRKTVDGDVELLLNPEDPITVTDWEVFLQGDGWYQVNLYGLDKLEQGSVTQVHEVNELVYDTTGNNIAIVDAVVGSGPFNYTVSPVSPVDNVATLENGDYTTDYKSTLNTCVTPELSKCHQRANRKFFASSTCGSPNTQDDWEFYLEITAILQSINYQFGLGQYATAQKEVECLLRKCECLTETCN